MARYAVVLLNLGGPDSLDAVEPFLANLFGDPDIFKLPAGQKFFARLMAKWRAPRVRERYRKIGGKSPINAWTALQAEKLAAALRKRLADIEVLVGMRYWRPAVRAAALRLSEAGSDRIVLLPLFPQYSATTTGSAFREWQRYYRGPTGRVVHVAQYCAAPKYIAAVNLRIDEALSRFPAGARPAVQIVFSAHGTPQSLVKQGDPYSRQIAETVERVMTARGFSHAHRLCFQSRVGPLKWLAPSVAETLSALAADEKKQILMVPISFVSDHIETLYELGIEYRDFALKCGIENYVVTEGLNDADQFIAALEELAMQALGPEAANG